MTEQRTGFRRTWTDLPPEAEAVLARYIHCRKNREGFAAAEKEAQDELIALLDPDTDEGRLGGDPVFTYRVHFQNRLDVGKLREEAPELAQAYTKPSPVRRFLLAKP